LATTSADQGSPIVAPAAVNALVGQQRACACARLDDHADVARCELLDDLRTRATRRSFGAVSLGTPTCIGAGT
jgi:hypothetical protein